MADPIDRLAKLRTIKASADLEVQFATMDGSAPAIAILRTLRESAAVALAALPFLNFDDPKDVIKAKVLSNEVKRYDEWFAAMDKLIADGKAYDAEMTESERNETADMLSQSPEGQQELIALGLLDDATPID